MVGKKNLPSNTTSTTKRSPVASEPALANRPRRNISPKNLDLTAGLSWREERELKKALYASLQETKKYPTKSEAAPVPVPTPSITRRSHGNYTATHTMTRRQSPRSTKPVLPAVRSHTELKSAKLRNALGVDESSQDSAVSSQTSVSCSTEDSRSKMKVRAQRKFAQMMAYGNSMTPQLMTPVKQSSKTSPIKVFPKRAKTEDFLTFLCLRGTQVLPPHLDFFNFSRDDGDSSCPATPSNGGHPGSSTRESSPCSSSTSTSNVDFENILGRVTPIRKAARACAGTPETARGFASIGPGSRTRNGSSHISKKRQRNISPAVTPSKPISPRKVSPLKRGISPRKTGTSDRLSIKKRALATLRASKMSPAKKQDRKKSLFSDSGSLTTGKHGMQKKLSVKNLRKSNSRGITNSKRSTKLEKSTGNKKKATTSYIADRLPKRQAKLRGYRYFLEEDELDPEVLCLKDTSPDRSKQRSPTRKRKSDGMADEDFDSAGPSIKVPLKKARIQKVEKKSIKAKSHGKILLRQIKNIKKKNSDKRSSSKFVSVSETVSEMSSGIHTRSGSVCKPEDVSNPYNPQSSSPSNSSANKMKVIKRPPKIENLRDKSARICEKKILNKNVERQLKKMKVREGKTSDEVSEGITFSRTKSKLSTLELAVKKRRKSPVKAKVKPEPTQKDVKLEPFPSPSELARIVEAPVFFPTEEEFADPMKYIQNIGMIAEPFGMCKIIPPSTWKPDGKINDETRFTTQKQYVHKMFQRYGPNVRQFKMIKKHLESLGVSEPVPVIGGVEIDLCKLLAIIEDLGGMQYVVEKKKWLKVADAMGISKAAQDRGTRLYEAYCKFLVSYDTLSDDEKTHLEDEVEEERDRVEDIEDEDECIVKGKNMPLPTFIRTSRNIASMWLKDEVPAAENVEREYWRILQERSNHIVVHGGHVDTQTHHCSLFASKKDSHCYRHPWNLNNLPHKSVLKYLGHISGVTVPTLHIGMPFTTSCWSSDTHNLPYVQYLHSESEIVWYSIPCHEEYKFKTAMASLAPTLISEEVRWLKEDTVMVPPDALTMNDVSVSRCVQRPGQFVIVFPRSYTATISCGYTLAESVHYATPDWIQLGMDAAKTLYSSHERELFSIDELLCRILEDSKASKDLLIQAISAFQIVVDEELRLRQQLSEAGLKASRRMCTAANLAQTSLSRRASCDVEEIISICDTSKKICYLSLVLNEADDLAFSLEHGLVHIQKKRNIKSCKLMYRHTEDELMKIISDTKERLRTMEATGSESSPRRKQQRKLEAKN